MASPDPPPEPVRLGRLETVAAWLRLWTPPRGAVVPPVPWRRVAVAGLGIVVVLGGVGAYALPRISDSKRESETSERTRAQARAAAERRRIEREMRPRRGRVARPALAVPRAAEVEVRLGILRAVERAITADARGRARAGTLDGVARRTRCVPSPRSVQRVGAERDPRRARDKYDCLAVVRDIPRTEVNRAGRLGHPFRAVVDFERGTFVWCKTNPLPGEAATPDPRDVPLLPAACRLG